MLKKTLFLVLIITIIFCFAGCGEKKTLHCDSCNKEIEVSAKSNMEEDWAVYCKECEKKLNLPE